MSLLKYVLPFLLLLPPSWPDVIEKVERSVVKVQIEDEGTLYPICSAVVVGDRKLLSEEHCFDDPAPRFAEGIPLSIDVVEGELALLSAEGRHSEWRPIKVRRSPLRRGEAVASIGFGFGGTRPIATLGSVSAVDDPDLAFHFGVEEDYFNLEVIRGQSGGAIVDRKGRLITLVRRVQGDDPLVPSLLAASARHRFLVEFLGRFGLLDN